MCVGVCVCVQLTFVYTLKRVYVCEKSDGIFTLLFFLFRVVLLSMG